MSGAAPRPSWLRGVAGDLIVAAYETRTRARDLIGAVREPEPPLDASALDGAPVGAVVVTSPGPIRPSVARLLQALARIAAPTVLISNGGPVEGEVPGRVVRHVRPNRGRDFGAYRAAALAAARLSRAPERLLVLNDSVFVRPGAEDEVVRLLVEASADYWGLTDSVEGRRHVSSYAFSVGRALLESDAWRAFWRSYRPWSSRRHAIDAGETGLAAAITAAGFGLGAVWDLPRAARELEALDPEALTLAVLRAPTLLRDRVVASAAAVAGVGIPGFDPAGAEAAALVRALCDQPSLRGAVARGLIEHGGSRSLVHWLGGPLTVSSGFPVLKKDLVYRGLYDRAGAWLLARDAGFDTTETEAEFDAKGPPVQRPRIRALLYRTGLV